MNINETIAQHQDKKSTKRIKKTQHRSMSDFNVNKIERLQIQILRYIIISN